MSSIRKEKGHWRKVSAMVIADVLANTEGMDERVISTALYDAYPFGPRQYQPYKIWLSEIRRQRGINKRVHFEAHFIQLALPF